MFYPLDFSRTRLTADTTAAGQQRPFTGIVSCLRHAWAQEGIRSWYKGMGMSLPGVVVYTSISFTAYDTLKVRYPQQPAVLSDILHVSAPTIISDAHSQPVLVNNWFRTR